MPAGLNSRFCLTRIVGNDLPPRHEPGQAARNLRFLLDHEPDLPGCEKRWIVNRIVDPQIEAAVIAALEARSQPYLRIAFDPQAYGSIAAVAAASVVPVDRPMRLRLNAAMHRINYAIPINRARNLALAAGDGDWTLPFDGSCFVSAAAWSEIRARIEANPSWRYVAVPMARLSQSDDVLSTRFRPNADAEPQIMFRHDAVLKFDEAYPYGRRDKVELLWRLGVRGPWDRWKDDAWDPPRPRPSATASEVGTAGWVLRLSSGRDEYEGSHAVSGARNAAREAAILRFLDSLEGLREPVSGAQ